MSVRVAFRCPAEDQVIGVVTGEVGAPIDASAIARNYEAAAGYAIDARAVKDGVQLLCPRCRNPVVVVAGDDDVYAVPGAMRFGQGRNEDGQAAR